MLTTIFLGTMMACVGGMGLFILTLVASGPLVERLDRKEIAALSELIERRDQRVSESLDD